MTTEFRSLAADNRPLPTTDFDRALHALLDDMFAAQPTWATQIGYHAFDDRWPAMTEAGRQARLELVSRHRSAVRALDETKLSPDERIDRQLTLETLDAIEFDETELREMAWDALGVVRVAGGGLFSLLARDFAPWEHRGSAFVGRLTGLPPFLRTAANGLTGLDGRPVSVLHAQVALAQLGGVTELIDQGLAEAQRQAAENGHTQIEKDMHQVEGAARAAVEEFRRTLSDQIMPRAEGESRLGRDLFAKKLQHTLASEITPEDVLARARRDYELVRAEMLRLARDAWNEWRPGEAMPDDGDETIRRVMDAIALQHPRPDELIEVNRAEIARIEAFMREHSVMRLPTEPLQITWTPVFMRAYGRAFLQAPGPLDKGLPSYFWITPPDESLGPEATESYLREDNDRMNVLMAVHEGVPGHYLQGAYANESPSLARAVFASGTFAEGWAVYVTQVLMDLGYRDNEPALMLTHWKFYLRAITNAIMDVAIHTEGMTEEQAMELMVGGGFQEQDEARAKWLRARISSTQLSTYYIGSLEMWALEVEGRRRAAVASGASAESVPDQKIAGGMGQTPGFDYRAHLEAVVSHGTPPIKWVRAAMFGQG
ncbi:MAG TPA: DUF885 domain-containing protein [Candidatus Limnocylindrales bacterium]